MNEPKQILSHDEVIQDLINSMEQTFLNDPWDLWDMLRDYRSEELEGMSWADLADEWESYIGGEHDKYLEWDEESDTWIVSALPKIIKAAEAKPHEPDEFLQALAGDNQSN